MAQNNFNNATNPFDDNPWWLSLAERVSDIPPDTAVAAAGGLIAIWCIHKSRGKALAITAICTAIAVLGIWVFERESYCGSPESCKAGELLITRTPYKYCDMDKQILPMQRQLYSCIYIGYSREAK